MEREELRTTLVNHLETLRRNLQVVSMEVLKTKYKKPFDALRQDICKAATAYTHFLVFDGMRIKHKYFDEAVPYRYSCEANQAAQTDFRCCLSSSGY